MSHLLGSWHVAPFAGTLGAQVRRTASPRSPCLCRSVQYTLGGNTKRLEIGGLLVFRFMPTQTVKQRAIDAIRTLPDDASLEDAIERLCFIAKVEEGLRQSDAGELIPHEEIKKQFLS